MLYEYIANNQTLRMQVYEDMKKSKYSDGGPINKINFKKFKLDDLIHSLPDDIVFMWIYKSNEVDDFDKYVRRFKNWDRVKSIDWTISSSPEMSLKKGSENLYMDFTVYNEDPKSPETPYTISLYTKDNHLGMKKYASNFVEKFKQGGSVRKADTEDRGSRTASR
jgi:hypothetical protein